MGFEFDGLLWSVSAMIALLLASSLMLSPLMLSAAAGPPVVQVPVEDPVLPAGRLHFAGASAEGPTWFDAGSLKRSNLIGVFHVTAVIVGMDAAGPNLTVARLWVDCPKQVYQVSSGRLYGADGVERRRSVFRKDKPLAEGMASRKLADLYCKAGKPDPGPDLSGLETAADYRQAVAAAIPN